MSRFLAPALALCLLNPAAHAISLPPRVIDNDNVVTHAIETGLQTELNEQQRSNLQALMSNYENAMNKPQTISDAMVVTPMFCAGIVGAFYIQVQSAVCSDTSGKVYYMITKSIGDATGYAIKNGVGVRLGAAFETFGFFINRDRSEPIRPHFTGASTGLAASNRVINLLKSLGVISFLSPKVSVYHSILGNQLGVMLGVRLGRIFEIGSISGVSIYETWDDYKTGLSEVLSRGPFNREGMQEKWEKLPRPQVNK